MMGRFSEKHPDASRVIARVVAGKKGGSDPPFLFLNDFVCGGAPLIVPQPT
jgi:hypothetical protein